MEGALFVGAMIALAAYGITVLQVHTCSSTPFIERKLNNVFSNGIVILLLYVVSKRRYYDKTVGEF